MSVKMTKKDLVADIAKRTGFSLKDINLTLESFKHSIVDHLKDEDNSVEILGFISFKNILNKEKKIFNPAKKEVVSTPAKRVIRCKVSSAIRTIKVVDSNATKKKK